MHITIIALFNLGIHQINVKFAFLNGDLDKEIYMKQSKEFVIFEKKGNVCKLVKFLFGLTSI